MESKYNGATDPFLIQIFEEIDSYSDWISGKALHFHEDLNQDVLSIDFTDIDQTSYATKIYSDRSFEISSHFEELDIWEPLDFDENILSDCNNLIDYLKNMPKTIFSKLRVIRS